LALVSFARVLDGFGANSATYGAIAMSYARVQSSFAQVSHLFAHLGTSVPFALAIKKAMPISLAIALSLLVFLLQ